MASRYFARDLSCCPESLIDDAEIGGGNQLARIDLRPEFIDLCGPSPGRR